MERLKRYNKQILAFLSAFVVLVGGVFSTSFDSKASETEYFLNYPMPATDGGHGYISVEVQDISTGSRFIDTWFFSAFADVGGQQSPAEMAVTVRSDTINFALARADNANSWYTVNLINGRGLYSTMFRAQSNANMYNYSSNGYRIVNFVYGGSCFVTNYVNRTDTVNVYYDESGSAILLRGLLLQMIEQNSRDQQMLDSMWNIMNSNNGINDRVEVLTQLQSQTNSKLDSANNTLNGINDRVESMTQLQGQTNSWLGKIWNSIQEFFNPSDEEKTESEEFESDTTEKSDEIGGLVEESKTDKPDVDDMSNSIDSNLDMTSANEYGAVLLNITENEYILQMLLIVVAVAIIAYVLFGKR